MHVCKDCRTNLDSILFTYFLGDSSRIFSGAAFERSEPRPAMRCSRCGRVVQAREKLFVLE